MTILGGVGTLFGPLLGAWIIKYFENIFSAFNEASLRAVFDWMPDWMAEVFVFVTTPFVGEGWHLSLGALFMIIVIFLPGGLVEGFTRLNNRFRKRSGGDSAAPKQAAQE